MIHQTWDAMNISNLTPDDALLVHKAQEATHLSYAPYSRFHVGAAVLLRGGIIVQGANQENASYPCGICAERSALATAQNLYPDTPVLAIALAALHEGDFTPDIVTPCGMCRQVIAETEQRYHTSIRIIMTSRSEAQIVPSINDLFPSSFAIKE